MCTALAASAGGTVAADWDSAAADWDSAAVAVAMADCSRCPCRAAATARCVGQQGGSFRKVRTAWVKRTDVMLGYSILRAHAIEGKPLPRPLHNYYLYHCIAYVQCSGARSAQASELRLHRPAQTSVTAAGPRCRAALQSKLRVLATPPLLRRRTWSGCYLGLGFGSRFG